MSSPCRVLVVGCGPSGLAAVKEMQEAGHDAIAVDSRSQFGGVFSPDSGVTFETLHLTISNMFMAFSDFPPSGSIKFWTKDEYFQYLSEYVDHFGIAKHLQLKTTIESAVLNKDKKWLVSLATTKDEQEQTEMRTFDYLIVASGANHKPNVPDIFGTFKGEIIHSSEYHSAEQVTGKKVLVVGTGESSVDVASSAAEVAESVTVWGRRYPDLAPRFITDYVDDSNYDEQRAFPTQENRKPKDFLEVTTITRISRNLPLAAWSVALQSLVSAMKWKHGNPSSQKITGDFVKTAWSQDWFSSDSSMVPTKSSIMSTWAARGLLDFVISPSLSCNGSTITFEKPGYYGTEFTSKDSVDVEADVIVACTGFALDFDWISTPDHELNTKPRSWFKHSFPPGLGEHMAFVGFARPHSGGIPQCSEMLSRYIALLCKGERQLPADYATIAKVEGKREREAYHGTPNYELLVDYMAFMMSVARLIGCTPKIPMNPVEMIKYWTFPQWPCFFRSRGVGAKPEATKAVLDKFGPLDAMAPGPLLSMQILFTFLMPFINLFSFIFGPVINVGKKTELPRGYQFTMSKFYFMYTNLHSMDAMIESSYQILAGVFLIVFLVLSVPVQTASLLMKHLNGGTGTTKKAAA